MWPYNDYCQISHRNTLVCNKIVYHSDVIGALPVGTAPTTFSFSTPGFNRLRRNNCKMRRHDDVIKWKHFLHFVRFVRGIHQSPVNSPHKDQWWGALMFSFICAWINGWVNTREAGELRCHHTHYDVTVMDTFWGYLVHLILEFWR